MLEIQAPNRTSHLKPPRARRSQNQFADSDDLDRKCGLGELGALAVVLLLATAPILGASDAGERAAALLVDVIAGDASIFLRREVAHRLSCNKCAVVGSVT